MLGICDNYSIAGHSLEMWSQLFWLGGFFLAVLSVGTKRPDQRITRQLVYHSPENSYPVHSYWQLLDPYYYVMTAGNRLMESPIFAHQDHHYNHLQGIIDI